MKTTHGVGLVALLFTTLSMAAAPAWARAQEVVEVPLEVLGGRMVVQARADDGTELRFLVTTGSSVTVLSESGAARIGGQGVSMGSVPVNMDGRQTVPDDGLTVDGVVMDGLVSNNTLNRFDALFDAQGGRLLLKPFGRAVEWPGFALSDPVRLRVFHGVVLGLDVEVGGKSYPAMLELGASSLLVNQAVLDGGTFDDGTADLRLGKRLFEDVPIKLSDNPVIARFSPNGDGFVLVGVAPALECAVAVSWIHRELRTCVP